MWTHKMICPCCNQSSCILWQYSHTQHYNIISQAPLIIFQCCVWLHYHKIRVTYRKNLERERSVWHISHTEWLQKRRCLLTIFFKFPLECIIRDVLPNKEKLKWIWTQQYLVCAHNVSLLGNNKHAIQRTL